MPRPTRARFSPAAAPSIPRAPSPQEQRVERIRVVASHLLAERSVREGALEARPTPTGYAFVSHGAEASDVRPTRSAWAAAVLFVAARDGGA